MGTKYLFNFKKDISEIEIPNSLNNPFGNQIPQVAKLAASQLQEYIKSQQADWNYDFDTKKGKMFGVLVVQQKDNSFGFLGTISGKFLGDKKDSKLTPSVFDDSSGDYFINKGMTELTDIGTKIKKAENQSDIDLLKETRKQKSLALQQRLFENYQFLNISGATKNVLQIFEDSTHGKPPSAAGECAAPKLLQYAFKHELKPMAIAEFWWGNPPKNKEREHQKYYPACKNKCRPILEYMLEDSELYMRKS